MRGHRPAAPRVWRKALLSRGACRSQERRNWTLMATRQEFGHVLGSIDVEHQTRYAQDIGVEALRERLIEMRAEAAGTKTALDAVRRRAHQRVCAGAIGGRH